MVRRIGLRKKKVRSDSNQVLIVNAVARFQGQWATKPMKPTDVVLAVLDSLKFLLTAEHDLAAGRRDEENENVNPACGS